MKITIEFEDDELQPALQEHLETGRTMHDYIRRALHFFDTCRVIEKSGRVIGYAEKYNMERYTTTISTEGTTQF